MSEDILEFKPEQASNNISQIFDAKETEHEKNVRIKAEVVGGIDFS